MAQHWKKKGEEGAEIIQLALAMPLLFVLAIAMVQICLMAFFTLTVSNEAEQAAWEVDLSCLEAGGNDANQLVKDIIVSKAVALDTTALQVENAGFQTTEAYSPHWEHEVSTNNIVYSNDHSSRYYLDRMYHDSAGGLLEFDVSYTLPTIINLPGLTDVTITKHVARERLLWTRTEVG